ncbi:caspase, EACC1-associated type [Streptomyces sp. A30]|uniref:caspase, EACC1-associated type n=1 Tax=Streptomyces sp. A30 TaxID=2789273 RepID=UPI00397FFD09
MTLPDPRESRAVLIGVSEYTTLPSLPAVRNNVEALKGILTSHSSWNLPSSNCVVIHNPRIPEELVDPIVQSAEEATDTLLVYYAGHGLKGANRGEFRLSRSTSRAGASHTSTDYNDIREALIESTAARRIVILDCCYAASALGVMADPTHSVAEDAAIEGTYLIAAAGETQVAVSDDGNGFTVFTGELVRLIRDGVPDDAREFIDLDTVFTHLRSSLRAKARPLPHRRVRNSLGGLTLAKNRQWWGWGHLSLSAEVQRPKSPRVEQVPQRPTARKAEVSGSAVPVEEVPGLLAPQERRPGGWPTAKKAEVSGSAVPVEEVPGLLAPQERRPGGWPTAKKAEASGSAVPVEEVPGLLAPQERRPGGWPTAKKAEASGSAVPVERQRPGAWPEAKKAAPSTTSDVTDSESDRAVWPTVKQPPRKDSTGLLAFEQVWSQILEEVKERRRFAWILLSHNAEVIRFDGQIIELEFSDEISKGNYRSAGLDSVLEGVIREKFDASWRVEVVDRKSTGPALTARMNGETEKHSRRPGEWPTSEKPIFTEAADSSSDIQTLWSTILDTVKTRRRFTWLLLSQNAKPTRFDGKKLRIDFVNDGSKETFLTSGSSEILGEVIRDVFGTSWEIDAVTRREI